MPLQTYRINNETVAWKLNVDYRGWGKITGVEGCTAPTYSSTASMQRLFASLPGWGYATRPSKNWSVHNVYNLTPSGPKLKMPQLKVGSTELRSQDKSCGGPSVYLDGEGARKFHKATSLLRMQVNTKSEVGKLGDIHNASLTLARLSCRNPSRKVRKVDYRDAP